MIIVLEPGITDAEYNHVLEVIEGMGFQVHVSKGVRRTIVGVIGEEDRLRIQPLSAIRGVERVIPVLTPFKLASREFQEEDSVIECGGVKIGGKNVAVIAGPCAVENREMLLEVARRVKKAGASMLRGGAYKPRTSPYSFRGLGKEGLEYLREAGDELNMPVVTEVMDARQVEEVEKYADVLQVGARNMQNFNLLDEVGQRGKPVLLKRGMSASVKELVMSAEYILSNGNARVILCERGIKTFEDSTRNTLDLSAVPNVRQISHLPVIVDPSHATGRAGLVPAMSLAAVAAGASGVMVEVHPSPERALSDGEQSITPDVFDGMMQQLRTIVAAMERELQSGRPGNQEDGG